MTELSYIHPELRPLAVRLDTLVPDPENARTHNPANLAAIRAMLVEFGQREALIVQKPGNIVRAGNGRLQVMRELGWTHAAVLSTEDSDIQATRYALGANRAAELAEWDKQRLAEQLHLLEQEYTLPELGFDASVLDELDAMVARTELLVGPPSRTLEGDVYLGVDYEDAEERTTTELRGTRENYDSVTPLSEPPPGPDVRTMHPAVKWTLIFDDEAQQERFFAFLRHLKGTVSGETAAARLDAHIQGVMAMVGQHPEGE